MTRYLLILIVLFTSCNPCKIAVNRHDKLTKKLELRGCTFNKTDTIREVQTIRDTVISYDTIIDSFGEIIIRDTVKIKEGNTSTKTSKGVKLTTTITNNKVITEATCDSLIQVIINKNTEINNLTRENEKIKSTIFAKVEEAKKRSFFEAARSLAILFIIILVLILLIVLNWKKWNN